MLPVSGCNNYDLDRLESELIAFLQLHWNGLKSLLYISVKDKLYPYVSDNLESYLKETYDEAETKKDITALRELVSFFSTNKQLLVILIHLLCRMLCESGDVACKYCICL